jgi:hypothetical protein
MKSELIERLTGTAGLSGSAGAAAWPPDTRLSAEWICPIKAGMSALGTELLLTYAETMFTVSCMKLLSPELSIIDLISRK